MLSQPELPEVGRGLGQILPYCPQWEHGPANSWISGFWPLNCETTHFCHLTLPVCGKHLVQATPVS